MRRKLRTKPHVFENHVSFFACLELSCLSACLLACLLVGFDALTAQRLDNKQSVSLKGCCCLVVVMVVVVVGVADDDAVFNESQWHAQCISGTDLLRQEYSLPHWDRSCRSNFLSRPVTAYRHQANQSQRRPLSPDAWQGSQLKTNDST